MSFRRALLGSAFAARAFAAIAAGAASSCAAGNQDRPGDGGSGGAGMPMGGAAAQGGAQGGGATGLGGNGEGATAGGGGAGGESAGGGGAGGAAGEGGSGGQGTGGAGSGGQEEDAGFPPPPDASPPKAGAVYGHSDTKLFKMDPTTKEVTIVGTFDCIAITFPGSGEGMWDIAVDKGGQMVGTSANLLTGGALVKIDKATAHCNVIASGTFPNSLTFVPEATLDPIKEVLVGFEGAAYLQIDPQTGQKTQIGGLNPNPTGKDWESSGDVVSIIGDKTYLTVKPLGSGAGFAGTDHIVEVDVLTGQATKLIGDTTYPKLWGLGYWAGTAYGFSATGQLCSIDLATGAGTGIVIPNIPAGLAWWGAGVTTAAPHM